VAETRSGGLFSSLRNLAGTVITIVQTRLEILSGELEEEKIRFLQLVVLVAAALVCTALGIVLLTFLIVILFWDTYRLLTLGLLTVFFLTAGGILAFIVRNKIRMAPKMFLASVLELTKDREHLTSHE